MAETERRRAKLVYFVQSASGLIKIGRAVDARSRFSSLQTGSAEKLTLLGVISTGNADALEGELHTRYRHTRRHGEWFQPTPELLTYIRQNALSPEEDRERWFDQIMAYRMTQEVCQPLGIPVEMAGGEPDPENDPTRYVQLKARPIRGGRKALLAAYKEARGLS